jgi:hypothetical protein
MSHDLARFRIDHGTMHRLLVLAAEDAEMNIPVLDGRKKLYWHLLRATVDHSFPDRARGHLLLSFDRCSTEFVKALDSFL